MVNINTIKASCKRFERQEDLHSHREGFLFCFVFFTFLTVWLKCNWHGQKKKNKTLQVFIIKVLNISITSTSFLASLCTFAFLLFVLVLFFFLMFSEVLLLLFVMRIHLRSTLLKKILSVWYRMAYYRHYVPVRSFQSCPALCDPMDCSLVGFSVHGILQAKMLEWTAAPSSQGSSWPRDWVHVACIAGRFFSTELGKPSRHCFVQ